jgi:ABC-type nitrate/sulfonate/bicarbonate transport system ATPase subunit
MVTTVGGRILIQQVSRIYMDHTGCLCPALEPTDLRIAPGEFVSLIGPSGCGKTTLLRLIAGLDTPTMGTLSLDDQVITAPHYSRGCVFQDPMLFPWRDVWHNVATGLEARGILAKRHDDVNAFLALVGLRDFAHSYPHQLSGGMAQRVALARALVNHPRVLLMDEPLGALDALTRMTMQGEILRLWDTHRMTVLFITHDIDEALYLSDRVLVMTERPGRIRADIPVDLPRPRTRHTPEFLAYRDRLLSLLGF